MILLSSSIKEQDKSFKIILSKSQSSLAVGKINGSASKGATSGTAIIVNETNPKITNLTASFTNTNQSVTYTLYVHNSGEKNAYLKNIIYTNVEEANDPKYCYTKNKELLDCNNILVETQIEDLKVNGSTPNINNVILEIGSYSKINITITNNSGETAPSTINVAIGDIYFLYEDK